MANTQPFAAPEPVAVPESPNEVWSTGAFRTLNVLGDIKRAGLTIDVSLSSEPFVRTLKQVIAGRESLCHNAAEWLSNRLQTWAE